MRRHWAALSASLLLVAFSLANAKQPERPNELDEASWSALKAVAGGATQQQRLMASDGSGGSEFGWSVALSGDTALVGAHNANAAYVYTRNGSIWTEQQKLVAPDPGSSLEFGWSVALSGDTALVGDRVARVDGTFKGAVHVYTRSGTTWTHEARLVADDGQFGDDFGQSVALSGNAALVGAGSDDVGANANQGSVYVFERDGALWTQEQKLVADGGWVTGRFGWSVALSGDTALVGAFQEINGSTPLQGAAYVFVFDGSNWTQQQKLEPSDADGEYQFGWSVAISGNTALVGAPSATVGGIQSGAAYLFTRTGQTWTLQERWEGDEADSFGTSVALSGDTALVGANSDDVGANNNQGSVSIFTRSGTIWTEQPKLLAADGATDDNFGTSMALSDDTLLVGARKRASNIEGSAYVFVGLGTQGTEPPRESRRLIVVSHAASAISRSC